MKKVVQFALKIDGKAILRSDVAENILQEITRQIKSKSTASGDSIMRSTNGRIFSDMVYIAGQIVDCIYHEIPTVSRTEMHLESKEVSEKKYDHPITNIIIKIEGPNLSKIHSQVEKELEFREFMYHDATFEIFEIGHNGSPSVVLQILPRVHIPLIANGMHTKGMSPEIKDQITTELRMSLKHTYTKTVIQRFLNCHCKCEYLRHAADLVELVLTQDGFSDAELRVAEICLEYLSDTREGQSLLLLWRNREAIRTRWAKHDTSSKTFISQAYEWFTDVRSRQCHQLSASLKPPLSVDKQEIPLSEANQFN